MTEKDTRLTRVEISKKLVFINSSCSLIALALNMTVLVWMQQYLLKRISPEEYSLLPVLYSIMMFIPLFTIILTSSLGRYITEAYAVNDNARVTCIVSTMFPILLGAGCIVAIVGGVLTYYLAQVLTIAPEYLREAKMMFFILMLSLSLKLFMAPFLVGLATRQKFILINFITTGGQFLRIALLFILLTTVSVKVLWVIVATVSAAVLTDFFILFFSLQAIPSLRFRFDAINMTVAKELLSYGGWSTVSGFAMTIRSSADAIILNKLSTSLEVTYYYLGSLPFILINRVSSTAIYPLNPTLISMYATQQPERLSRAFLKGGRYALWFTLFISVPLMVYNHEIISLYVGSKFQQAGVVMLVILLVLPVSEGIKMLYPLAEASANIRTLSIYTLVISLFNLCLTLYLVGVLKMGALGSALGTAISIGLLYPVLLFPLSMKISNIKFNLWIKKTLLPGIRPAIAALIVLLTLKSIVSLDSWFKILGCISAGSLVYLSVLCLSCLQSDDRQDLEKVLTKLKEYPVITRLMSLMSINYN